MRKTLSLSFTAWRTLQNWVVPGWRARVSSAAPTLSSSLSLHNPQINYKLLQRSPPMTDWVTVLRALSSFWIPLLSLFIFCQNGVCFCQHHVVCASAWTHFPFHLDRKTWPWVKCFHHYCLIPASQSSQPPLGNISCLYLCNGEQRMNG